jgi:hypothetical protein
MYEMAYVGKGKDHYTCIRDGNTSQIMHWRLFSMLYWQIDLINFFNLHSGGVESNLGPFRTWATYWPSVPAPGDCEDGEFGGMNGRGNRSTRRKPALTPLCPPQIPLDQTQDWTRAPAVGRQQLTASAMVRPDKITYHPHQMQMAAPHCVRADVSEDSSSYWMIC